MLVALLQAYTLAVMAAAPASPPASASSSPRIVALPVAGLAGWPMRRCGDGVPGGEDAAAGGAIDAACLKLTVPDRRPARDGHSAQSANGPFRAGDDAGAARRLARAVLPGLQGMVGSAGRGLGLGSELALARGARMTLHLAAPRDTRIAATMFAPETTVLARCGACWTESDAIGAGVLNPVRKPAPTRAPRAGS